MKKKYMLKIKESIDNSDSVSTSSHIFWITAKMEQFVNFFLNKSCFSVKLEKVIEDPT